MPALMATAPVTPTWLDEALHRLGGVSPSRVVIAGWPCTEERYLEILGQTGRHFELVDGLLVEKTVGIYESRVGFLLGRLLDEYAEKHDLGIVIVETGTVRIVGQVRMPDAAFYPWSQFPGRLLPRAAIHGIPPDLAVEVMSPSNTAAEMERKRRECFAAGTRLVWEVEPELRQARVFTAADTFTVKTLADTLEGEPVLPGFRLPLRELFDRAGAREQPAT
jgi:Uma2 family endonuclease